MSNPFSEGPFSSRGFDRVFGAGAGEDLAETLGQIKRDVEATFGPVLSRVSGRAGRGDVRAAILSLLAEEPMHGYQLIQRIEERSGGTWRPSPGSVYPTLQLLTDEGLVEVEEAEGRKTYSLTEAGRAQADAANGAEREAPRSAPTPAGRAGALAKAGANLTQAALQLGRTGTEEQIAEGVEVLDGARRALYGILARD